MWVFGLVWFVSVWLGDLELGLSGFVWFVSVWCGPLSVLPLVNLRGLRGLCILVGVYLVAAVIQ